jgi:hypothetical protein
VPRVDREADLAVRLADDLGGDDGSGCRSVASMAGIGEGLDDQRKGVARPTQRGWDAITILDIGRLRLEDEATPVRVDHRLPLAALDLLSCVMVSTLWLSMTRAVGHGITAGPLLIRHDQAVIDLGERAGIAPAAGVAEDRALGGMFLESSRHVTPPRRTWKIAFRISRIGQSVDGRMTQRRA